MKFTELERSISDDKGTKYVVQLKLNFYEPRVKLKYEFKRSVSGLHKQFLLHMCICICMLPYLIKRINGLEKIYSSVMQKNNLNKRRGSEENQYPSPMS